MIFPLIYCSYSLCAYSSTWYTNQWWCWANHLLLNIVDNDLSFLLILTIWRSGQYWWSYSQFKNKWFVYQSTVLVPCAPKCLLGCLHQFWCWDNNLLHCLVENDLSFLLILILWKLEIVWQNNNSLSLELFWSIY